MLRIFNFFQQKKVTVTAWWMEGNPFSTPNLDRVAISWPSFVHFYVMVISCFSFSFICILRSSFTTSFFNNTFARFRTYFGLISFLSQVLATISKVVFAFMFMTKERELQFGTVTCLVRKMKKKKNIFLWFLRQNWGKFRDARTEQKVWWFFFF